MTDAEKFVKEIFSKASCKGPFINGRLVRSNGWFVISGGHRPPYSSVPDGIGRGRTEIAAWADAANRIESDIDRFKGRVAAAKRSAKEVSHV